MITLRQALLLALIYWLSGRTWLSLAFSNLNWPLVNGFFIGLVMGDPIGGTILGGTLQTLNMAPSMVGHVTAMDMKMAAFITIPMALSGQMEVDTILAFAVPFTVLGAFIQPLCRTLNQFCLNIADKAAAKGDTKLFYFAAYIMEGLIQLPFYFGIMFVALYFGQGAMSILLGAIPDWLMLTFITLAKFLPGIGFAMFLYASGEKKLMPYFFLGFYVMYFFGAELSLIGMTIFGAILGVLYVMNERKSKEVAVNE